MPWVRNPHFPFYSSARSLKLLDIVCPRYVEAVDNLFHLRQACLTCRHSSKGHFGTFSSFSETCPVSPHYELRHAVQSKQLYNNKNILVSQELWKLVMEAGLVTELGDLKAVFLLGRGELYQTLIPLVTPFLMNSCSPSASEFCCFSSPAF